MHVFLGFRIQGLSDAGLCMHAAVATESRGEATRRDSAPAAPARASATATAATAAAAAAVLAATIWRRLIRPASSRSGFSAYLVYSTFPNWVNMLYFRLGFGFRVKTGSTCFTCVMSHVRAKTGLA